MRAALGLILLSAVLILALPTLAAAQTCGDGSCGDGEKESCPADCPTDPCAGVSCSPTTITCADGTTVSCENACSGGTCSSCTPSCPSSGGGSGGGSDTGSGGGSSTGPLITCGDGICASDSEKETCPSDCTPSTSTTSASACGNGICEDGEKETCLSDCPGDCPEVYEPVCGKNGQTYGNSCEADVAGSGIECKGPCPCSDAPPTLSCPDQISCPDGSTVACEKQDNFCSCQCPLPGECVKQVDESGYTHVFCENEKSSCAAVPADRVKRCLEEGGRPEARTDSQGCEIVECAFQEQRSFFGPQPECPAPEAIETKLHACSELGLEGKIVFEGGCKIGKCIEHGQVCEDVRAEAKECSDQGRYPRPDYDDSGCKIVRCEEEPFCQRSLPEEAYAHCEKEGGELVVQQDGRGCMAFSECIRRGDPNRVEYKKVDKVPETSALLGIAFKLEALIKEIDELSRKSTALADYYASVGSADENRFRRVASMFTDAKDEVNQIKDRLRQQLNDLTTGDIEEFKRGLAHLKEVTLKDILYVMLSSSEEAVSSFEEGRVEETDDFVAFEKAFRICEPAAFQPDDNVEVRLEGVDDQGRCIMKAVMTEKPDFAMECKIADFSKGMQVGEEGPGPQTMDEWNCVGPMADAIRTGNFASAAPPEAQTIMQELGCTDQQSCAEACFKPGNFPLCQKLAQIFGGHGPGGPGGDQGFQGEGQDFGPPPGFEDDGFGPPPGSFGEGGGFEGEGFGGGNACSGCLNNGVCDPGECSECADCGGF